MPAMSKTLANQASKSKGRAASGPCANPLCRSGKNSFLLCNGCKIVFYCNEDCQRAHWGQKGDPDRHKPVCKGIRAAAAAAQETMEGGGGSAEAGGDSATDGATPSTKASKDVDIHKRRCGDSQGGSGSGDEPEHTLPKVCASCGESKGKPKFTNGQWKDDASGVCRECEGQTNEVPRAEGGVENPTAPAPPGKTPLAPSAGVRTSAGAAASEPALVTNECKEFEHRCPICLSNEDDACVNGSQHGMCTACGQMFCSACNGAVKAQAIVVDGKVKMGAASWTKDALHLQCKNCPMCRAEIFPSFEQQFKRCLKLVNDRSPGRYSSSAFFQIGLMYKDGHGVAQSDTEAAKWLTLAAERGYMFAQHTIGAMAWKGVGMIKSVSKAVEWLKMAAEQGHSRAQANLGMLYGGAEGYQVDNAEAARYYKLAGAQGEVIAQYNLASMFQDGRASISDGSTQSAAYKRALDEEATNGFNRSDEKEAIKWHTLAAEQGFSLSQVSLGQMYLKSATCGNGEDMRLAINWLQHASEQGEKTSADGMLDAIQQMYEGVHKIPLLEHRIRSWEMFGGWELFNQQEPMPTDVYKPASGTTVTVVCLKSSASVKYNGRTGKVADELVLAAAAVSPGRVAVRLDASASSDARVLSFKLKNLRIEPPAPSTDGDDTRLGGHKDDAATGPSEPNTCTGLDGKAYITCVPRDDPANVLNGKFGIFTGVGGTQGGDKETISVEVDGKVWSVPAKHVAVMAHHVQTPTKDAGGNDPECFICFEAGSDVISLGCACRDEAGTAHLMCMVAAISASETRESTSDISRWNHCQICRSEFEGPMQLGLAYAAVEKTEHLQPGAGKRVHADHMRGFALLYAQRFNEAEAAFRILFRFYHKHAPKTDTASMELTHGLAESVLRLGKVSEAIALHRQNLKLRRHALGAHNKHTFASEGALATALSVGGQHDEAERVYRATIAGMKKYLPKNDPHILVAVGMFIGFLSVHNKYIEAVKLAGQMLPVYERTYGPHHANTVLLRHQIMSMAGQIKAAQKE